MGKHSRLMPEQEGMWSDIRASACFCRHLEANTISRVQGPATRNVSRPLHWTTQGDMLEGDSGVCFPPAYPFCLVDQAGKRVGPRILADYEAARLVELRDCLERRAPHSSARDTREQTRRQMSAYD